MALKTIHFTVGADGGLSPSTVQSAGVQGNHRIYELLFEFSDELYAWLQEKGNEGKLVYRFDGYDGTGAVHHSDTAILCEKSVSYPLEYLLTRHGGLVKVELIITLVKERFEDGEVLPDITDEVLHTHAAQLKLIFSPYSAGDRGGQYLDMASLAEVAKANAEKAIKAAEEAIKAQKLTEELSAALQNGAEFIFDGGDASGDLDINFVVDNEMSDYSTNPVANRVVKKYVKDTVSDYVDEKLEEFEDENITEEADYVVEQGKDGNWTYRKWNSGIAECWAYEEYGNISFNTFKNGAYCSNDKDEDCMKSILPVTFVNGASESSIQGNACKLFIVGGCWVDENILKFDTYSLQQLQSQQVDVRWYVVGRWK